MRLEMEDFKMREVSSAIWWNGVAKPGRVMADSSRQTMWGTGIRGGTVKDGWRQCVTGKNGKRTQDFL